MKNKILDFHPILGAITYNDLINDLSSLLEDYNTLEETIQDILKNNNYDDECISFLKVYFKVQRKNRSYCFRSFAGKQATFTKNSICTGT